MSEPTKVSARKPSNAKVEAKAEVENAPVDLKTAVRTMLDLVEAHRTIGDSDLAAAVADVEAALAD